MSRKPRASAGTASLRADAFTLQRHYNAQQSALLDRVQPSPTSYEARIMRLEIEVSRLRSVVHALAKQGDERFTATLQITREEH